ncbi:MAG: hypothetical protein WBL70_20355 [Candidatus Acidiferrales bacterium]
MAYHFEFNSTLGILRGRLEGQITDEGLREFYRTAAEYVALLDPRAGVTDFSGVSSFDVSVQTIRGLAMSAPAMPKTSRPRVIVASASHIYGMARMFEEVGEATRPNLHVVRTTGEAWAILGVAAPGMPEPQFEPVRAALDSSNADFSS